MGLAAEGVAVAIARPAHLTRRQVTGRAFGETATLIRTSGSRDQTGVYTETETREDLDCATAPASEFSSRVRAIMEGGIQLDAIRMFWHETDLHPASDGASGDLIEYAGDRYRVRSTQRWGGFSQSLGVRQEGQ